MGISQSGTRHRLETSGPTATGYTNGVKTSEETLSGSVEVSDSMNHAGFPSLLGSGANIGGAWLMTRDQWSYQLGSIISGKFKGSDSVISGGIGDQNHPSPPSDSSLYPKGATAISQSIPTNPCVQGATALAESLGEGIPSLFGVQTWKHRTQLAQGAGSEYLNYEFGWLPLVSDIRKFAYAVKNHEKVLHDLMAGSGKTTRVGMAFPSGTSSSSGTTSCFLHKGGNTGVSVSVSGYYTKYQESNTWFKGAFKYHIPCSPGQLSDARRYAEYADKLLGLKPTPSAIWNASPWTWALDWFTNAGDVVNNISALHQNGLALVYGYLMTSVKSTDTITTTGNSTWSSASRTHVREFKKRIPASPYGFGISDGSLSSAQKAVIAALGITKAR